MKKLSISLNERRFLIIWNIFHLFGLFVKVSDLEGSFTTGKSHHTSYIWNNSEDFIYKGGLWPFVRFYEDVPGSTPRGTNLYFDSYSRFNGIYYAYGIDDYFFYTILGFLIIFIPKILKNS